MKAKQGSPRRASQEAWVGNPL